MTGFRDADARTVLIPSTKRSAERLGEAFGKIRQRNIRLFAEQLATVVNEILIDKIIEFRLNDLDDFIEAADRSLDALPKGSSVILTLPVYRSQSDDRVLLVNKSISFSGAGVSPVSALARNFNTDTMRNHVGREWSISEESVSFWIRQDAEGNVTITTSRYDRRLVTEAFALSRLIDRRAEYTVAATEAERIRLAHEIYQTQLMRYQTMVADRLDYEKIVVAARAALEQRIELERSRAFLRSRAKALRIARGLAAIDTLLSAGSIAVSIVDLGDDEADSADTSAENLELAEQEVASAASDFEMRSREFQQAVEHVEDVEAAVKVPLNDRLRWPEIPVDDSDDEKADFRLP
ncbi:MAG: hypothetical protein AAGI88_23745 [Pseudomonadota bacterium]